MKNEHGRSMLEMLSVLAIIGILSATALNGFRYSMNKNRANRVVGDASLIYEAVETEEIDYPEWTNYPITAESGLLFKVIKAIEEDGVLTTFVQALEVPQGTCEHMLKMKTDKFKFYDVYDDGAMALDEKEECAEINNIAFAFNGQAATTNGSGESGEGGNNNGNSNGNSCTQDSDCPEGRVCSSFYGGCVEDQQCSDDEYAAFSHRYDSWFCDSCPDHATCDGVSAVCDDGYFTASLEGSVACCNKSSEYANAGRCHSCPSGATCNETGITNCGAGKYRGKESYDGSFDCIDCPDDAICDGTANVTCDNGKYWYATDTDYGSCDDCPSGATCENGPGTTSCGSGQVEHTSYRGLECCTTDEYWNGWNCSSCPYGATCDGTNIVTCGNGKYKSGNSCYSCPSGATCEDGTGIISCGTGKYKNGNSCYSCPSGATCDGKNITNCGSGQVEHTTSGLLRCCSTSQYWRNNSCQSCPSGATCDGTNVNCGSGKYWDSSWVSCRPCPSGRLCDGISASCGSGKYLRYNSCYSCPSGATCDGVNITNCGSDKYWNFSWSSCSSCPSGATCDGTNIVTCGSGKYKNQSGTSCYYCPSGATCEDGTGIISCGSGKYKDSDSCYDCPSGANCDGVNITNCGSGQGEHTTSSGSLRCCSTSQYWVGWGCYSCPDDATCDGTDIVTCGSGKYKSGDSGCRTCVGFICDGINLLACPDGCTLSREGGGGDCCICSDRMYCTS